MRVARLLTRSSSGSWKTLGTRPVLIAAIVSCRSCAESVSARHSSPESSTRATSSLRSASATANWRGRVGGGATSRLPSLPQPARQSAAARAAPRSRDLVRVFLLCMLQDRDTPFDELLHAGVASPLVERLQDLPVIRLARAGRPAAAAALARAFRSASLRSNMGPVG